MHVLFAVLMYPLITDAGDHNVRQVFFGQRDPEPGERSPVPALLPSDFGTEGYARRRRKPIEKHLSKLPTTSKGLAMRFESLLGESWPLRQYLWAHKIEDAERALEVLAALPPDRIYAILQFLVGDYWGRYLGWPDLVAHGRGQDYFLAEVKGSGDKLSEDQKEWIQANSRELQLPFRIYKVHRRDEVDRASLADRGR